MYKRVAKITLITLGMLLVYFLLTGEDVLIKKWTPVSFVVRCGANQCFEYYEIGQQGLHDWQDDLQIGVSPIVSNGGELFMEHLKKEGIYRVGEFDEQDDIKLRTKKWNNCRFISIFNKSIPDRRISPRDKGVLANEQEKYKKRMNCLSKMKKISTNSNFEEFERIHKADLNKWKNTFKFPREYRSNIYHLFFGY